MLGLFGFCQRVVLRLDSAFAIGVAHFSACGARIAVGPAVFLLVGCLVTAVAFRECCCDFLGPMGFLGWTVFFGFGYCFFYGCWVSKELCSEFLVWALGGH